MNFDIDNLKRKINYLEFKKADIYKVENNYREIRNLIENLNNNSNKLEHAIVVIEQLKQIITELIELVNLDTNDKENIINNIYQIQI